MIKYLSVKLTSRGQVGLFVRATLQAFVNFLAEHVLLRVLMSLEYRDLHALIEQHVTEMKSDHLAWVCWNRMALANGHFAWVCRNASTSDCEVGDECMDLFALHVCACMCA